MQRMITAVLFVAATVAAALTSDVRAGGLTQATSVAQLASILVQVQNGRGEPVPGAVVLVELLPTTPESREETDLPVRATSGADGMAWIVLPRAGIARVTVNATGYLTTVLRFIDLADGTEVLAAMERGGTLLGYVEDTFGKSRGGVSLLVLKSEDDGVGPEQLAEFLPPVTTSEDGTFMLEGLSSGYYVALIHDELEMPAAVELVEAVEPVHVEEDGVSTLVVRVKSFGKIEGNVKFRGIAPSQLLITPVPAARDRFDEGFLARHQTSIPTHGESPVHYVLDRLPSGEYHVELEAEGYAPRLSSDTLALPIGGTVEVPLQTMDEGTRVEGTLRAGGGERRMGDIDLSFFFAGIDIRLLMTRSTSDGTFQVGHLAPGRYIVKAEAPGVLPLSEEITIEPGKSRTSVDLIFKDGAAVEGTLLTNRQPQADVSVFLVRVGQDGGRLDYGVSKTDAGGGFAFRGLPGGRYSLLLLEPGIMKELTITGEQRVKLTVETTAEQRWLPAANRLPGGIAGSGERPALLTKRERP